MADQPIKYNSQIEKDEHDDSANIGGKRVVLYAWNSSTLEYERVLSNSGVLQTSASLTGGSTTVTYNATPPTLTDGQSTTLQGDENGNLKISGSISATNPSVGSNTSSIPTSSTLIGTEDGSGKLQAVSSTNPLPISGSITASNPSVGTSGSAIPTSSTLIGGSDGTDLQPLQVDSSKNLKTIINAALPAGSNTIGSVDINGTVPVSGTFWQTTQPVSGTVTANAGTNLNTSSLALESGGNLATIATNTTGINNAVGTGGSAIPSKGLMVQGSDGTNARVIKTDTAGNVDVNVQGTVPVSGTFWQATQPISAASLPLPSGAATSAKQPALGTAGSASTDVLSVQGIASMTALKVDGSGTTQPISGTVTANAGTNLNTSALALESGGNLATLAGIVSSSKAAVKIADGDITTLGNKIDAKSTATDTTSVSVMQVLKEISYMSQNPASTPVTGTFWQSTQPVSLASLPALASGSNVIGKVDIDQTTIGTTNGVTLVPSSAGGTGWQFKAFDDGTNFSNASGTKLQIVGSAATFGGYINLYNPNAAASYVQVFNKASSSVTLGTTTPDFVITLPGLATASGTGTDRNMELANGVQLSTGFTIAVTTGPKNATAPATAVTGTILYN